MTFVLSIGAVVQKNHVTMGFVLLNWMLIVDALIVIVTGTIVWYFTLGERAHYFGVFNSLSRDTRIEIQDKVRFTIASRRPDANIRVAASGDRIAPKSETNTAALRTVLVLWLLHAQRHRRDWRPVLREPDVRRHARRPEQHRHVPLRRAAHEVHGFHPEQHLHVSFHPGSVLRGY